MKGVSYVWLLALISYRVGSTGGRGKKEILYCYILFDSLICLWWLQIDWSVRKSKWACGKAMGDGGCALPSHTK